MAELRTGSAMAREIAEVPAAAGRLLARIDAIAGIAQRIEQAKPRIVIFCGRGSSGHVGVYLRYLFEARLGLLVSLPHLSFVTAYRGLQTCAVPFVVVSQSAVVRYCHCNANGPQIRGADAAIVNDETLRSSASNWFYRLVRKPNLRCGYQNRRAFDDCRRATGCSAGA